MSDTNVANGTGREAETKRSESMEWLPLVGAQQDCFAPKWFADAYILVISLTDSSAVIISSVGVRATNKGRQVRMVCTNEGNGTN